MLRQLENLTKMEFITMTDLRQKKELLSLIRALYAEDLAASPVNPSLFGPNVEFLIANPSRGRIVLFIEGAALVGYALLIPYWSNEFGGTLLFIDELFVEAEARNRGIGRSFFKYLDEARPFEAVALGLEVSPRNKSAYRMYESLGFRPRQNAFLTRRFGQDD